MRINVLLSGHGTFPCGLQLQVAVSCAIVQKRKSFDVSIKLNAVESAEKQSKEADAREFGIEDKSGNGVARSRW